MKHYHGTPVGGKRAKVIEFVENRFVLVPWLRCEDLQVALEYARGVVVDNSAFTFWRSGEKPNWAKYVCWCREICYHPRFEFALIPDVIDGTTAENNHLIDFWTRTAKGVEGCPVWHLHESIDRLKWLVSNWRRVAFGSSGEFANPGQSDRWWGRMDEAFDAICFEGLPLSRVHGLRMLREDIVRRYPFASCDSTNAVQNGSREAAKNRCDSAWGRQTLAHRIEMVQSPSRWLGRVEHQDTLAMG